MKYYKNTKRARYSTHSIQFDNGKTSRIPDQSKFKSNFIKSHGCSLSMAYLFIRYFGKDKPMTDLKRYMDTHYSLHGHAKYSQKQMADAINKIIGRKVVQYVASPTRQEIEVALKKGPVGFEEKNPIHSVFLVRNAARTETAKVLRVSNGKGYYTTVGREIAKRCGDSYYRGAIFVR